MCPCVVSASKSGAGLLIISGKLPTWTAMFHLQRGNSARRAPERDPPCLRDGVCISGDATVAHRAWRRHCSNPFLSARSCEMLAPERRGRAPSSGASMSIRPVKRIVQSQPTIEGAGVKLRRAFGFGETGETDPFLLLDDFRNDRPADYLKGFPWHPHRGVETITEVPSGSVSHGDSLGNSGTLGSGDIQWMTAGRGILHQEMPKGDAQGRMHGFQLWANLPSSLKMTAPRYQDVKGGEIPEVTEDDGTRVRIVCGEVWGRRGPVDGVAADPQYVDVWVPPGVRRTFRMDTRRNAFAYVFEGSGSFREASPPQGVLMEQPGPIEVVAREPAGDRSLVLFGAGDDVTVRAGESGIRFLMVSGRPLEEPVAWYGPIVMNTEDELVQAYAELEAGTFIRGG